jgi:hypothetical protein
MNCPNCNEKAIKFSFWIRSHNAFSTNCMNCGIKLSANYIVYLNFLLTLIGCAAFFPFINDIWYLIGYEPRSSHFKALILIPFIVVGALVTWLLGGYKIARHV